MKFKSAAIQNLSVYNDNDGHDLRQVKDGEIIDINFVEVVESYFHQDVLGGFFIPFDQSAIDWACKHMEPSAC